MKYFLILPCHIPNWLLCILLLPFWIMSFQHLKRPTFGTDQLPSQNLHITLCQFCKGHLLFQGFCAIHKQKKNRMICGKILQLCLFLLQEFLIVLINHLLVLLLQWLQIWVFVLGHILKC